MLVRWCSWYIDRTQKCMRSVKLYYSPSENVRFKHDIIFSMMKRTCESALFASFPINVVRRQAWWLTLNPGPNHSWRPSLLCSTKWTDSCLDSFTKLVLKTSFVSPSHAGLCTTARSCCAFEQSFNTVYRDTDRHTDRHTEIMQINCKGGVAGSVIDGGQVCQPAWFYIYGLQITKASHWWPHSLSCTSVMFVSWIIKATVYFKMKVPSSRWSSVHWRLLNDRKSPPRLWICVTADGFTFHHPHFCLLSRWSRCWVTARFKITELTIKAFFSHAVKLYGHNALRTSTKADTCVRP